MSLRKTAANLIKHLDTAFVVTGMPRLIREERDNLHAALNEPDDGWINLRTLPIIEDGQRVWFANEFGVWAGRWDTDEHHKGLGRAYPYHVMIIDKPSAPKEKS